MSKNTKDISKIITKLINKISIYEEKKIKLAAQYISKSHLNGGQLFLFGTGHNHCLAEEALHRSGGFANTCPIMDEKVNFTKGVKLASKLERTKGVASKLKVPFMIPNHREIFDDGIGNRYTILLYNAFKLTSATLLGTFRTENYVQENGFIFNKDLFKI